MKNPTAMSAAINGITRKHTPAIEPAIVVVRDEVVTCNRAIGDIAVGATAEWVTRMCSRFAILYRSDKAAALEVVRVGSLAHGVRATSLILRALDGKETRGELAYSLGPTSRPAMAIWDIQPIAGGFVAVVRPVRGAEDKWPDISPGPGLEAQVPLVVDDDAAFARALPRAFGLRANHAASIEEGLLAAAANPPSVVLLDNCFPSSFGVDAVPMFKAVAPGAAVVIVSSFVAEIDAQTAFGGGADGVIEKGDIGGLGDLLRIVGLADLNGAAVSLH